jgi:hypothetical protein
MPKILKVNDPSDSFHKEMPYFDLPFKLLLNGKSQLSGKSSVLLNILLQPEFGYDKEFKGKNIYIISNNKLDMKLKILAEYKNIPEDNIMEFEENNLMNLYEEIEELFLEEQKEKNIQHRLLIFEDCGASNALKSKQAGVISRLVCQGRHCATSCVFTSQRYSQVSTLVRTNLTGAILFSTSTKELDLIADDMSYLETKKQFVKLFRNTTAEPRAFLVVNFTNKDGLYMDTEFQTIDTKLF